MTLRLSRLVPDEYDIWYYHEKSGLLLFNAFERGWLAVNTTNQAEKELEELQEALERVEKPLTKSALPLPDDYEHALPPSWERS